MKTNIQSKVHLFIYFQDNNIMVNKREKKIFVIISISDKRLSSFYFFYLFPFTLFFFSPYLLVLILSYLSGTCILVCQHIWTERAFLFANISGRNVHSCLPTYLGGTCILVCQHIWAERAFLFANISGRNVHSCLPTYLGGTCILVCQHIWAELFFLFWMFLKGTFFQRVHGHPPAYAPGF